MCKKKDVTIPNSPGEMQAQKNWQEFIDHLNLEVKTNINQDQEKAQRLYQLVNSSISQLRDVQRQLQDQVFWHHPTFYRILEFFYRYILFGLTRVNKQWYKMIHNHLCFKVVLQNYPLVFIQYTYLQCPKYHPSGYSSKYQTVVVVKPTNKSLENTVVVNKKNLGIKVASPRDVNLVEDYLLVCDLNYVHLYQKSPTGSDYVKSQMVELKNDVAVPEILFLSSSSNKLWYITFTTAGVNKGNLSRYCLETKESKIYDIPVLCYTIYNNYIYTLQGDGFLRVYTERYPSSTCFTTILLQNGKKIVEGLEDGLVSMQIIQNVIFIFRGNLDQCSVLYHFSMDGKMRHMEKMDFSDPMALNGIPFLQKEPGLNKLYLCLNHIILQLEPIMVSSKNCKKRKNK